MGATLLSVARVTQRIFVTDFSNPLGSHLRTTSRQPQGNDRSLRRHTALARQLRSLYPLPNRRLS